MGRKIRGNCPMQKSIFAFAAALFMLAPGLASADQVSDRRDAIALCRAEVAAQTGLPLDDVRFDEARVSGRSVRVDIDVWRDGRLTNVRCDVSRSAELVIAGIEPALRSAAVINPTISAQ